MKLIITGIVLITASIIFVACSDNTIRAMFVDERDAPELTYVRPMHVLPISHVHGTFIDYKAWNKWVESRQGGKMDGLVEPEGGYTFGPPRLGKALVERVDDELVNVAENLGDPPVWFDPPRRSHTRVCGYDVRDKELCGREYPPQEVKGVVTPPALPLLITGLLGLFIVRGRRVV